MIVASTSVPRFDDEAQRVELPVDLRQELRRQAKLVDRLAKPPGQTPRIKSATLLQRSPAIDCRKTKLS
jgi:hypothetical protein